MIMDSNTVHIYLQSYELSKPYLRRSLESIRNQTYTNFICHIFDNGSGAEVKAIIKRYVEEDDRFRALYYNQSKKTYLSAIPHMLRFSNVSGYYMRVDADDELELIALECMVAYAQQHKLDMTVAGAHFIDGETGRLLGDRSAARSVIVDGAEYSTIFSETYQLMRTHWIKLFKMSVMKKINLANVYGGIGYGGDTLFVRECILHSDRIGIMKDVLYKYYQISYATKSYYKNISRIHAPELLLNADVNFLFNKCGFVSEDNLFKLLSVYTAEMAEVVSLILKGNYGDDKIGLLHSVLCNKWMKLAFSKVSSKLGGFIANWLIRQKFWNNETDFDKAVEIFSTISLMPNVVPECPVGTQLLFFLKLYHTWDNKDCIDMVERNIKGVLKDFEILKDLNVEFLCDCINLVQFIVNDDYHGAKDWVDECLDDPMNVHMMIWGYCLIKVGVVLAAVYEDAEWFVRMKKTQIEYLTIENPELAREELAEWSEIL